MSNKIIGESNILVVGCNYNKVELISKLINSDVKIEVEDKDGEYSRLLSELKPNNIVEAL